MTNPTPNTNSPYDSGPGSGSPVIIGISIALGVVLLIGLAVYLWVRHNNANNVTITIPPAATSPSPSPSPGASPTPTVSTASSAPNYTGFDNLTNYGISSDQENDAQYGFIKFSKATGLKLTQVDIDENSLNVVPHSPTSEVSYATFNVTLNGQTQYQARLAYTGLTEAELYLINPKTGAQVFDSGQIDVYNGIGD